MSIKITQHVSLPPVFACPVCLESTDFVVGEKWQMCSHSHFVSSNKVDFNTQPIAIEPPPAPKKWQQPIDNSFGVRE
jgi:hypothetical protein